MFLASPLTKLAYLEYYRDRREIDVNVNFGFLDILNGLDYAFMKKEGAIIILPNSYDRSIY